MTGKEAARLFVTVGADTSSFQSGMRGVTSTLRQTEQATSSTMGMFKQFALGQIVGTYALQALNGALGFAKDSIIGYNATLEQANIGFTTMLGSGEKAATMLKDLQKFAASTPFEFTGLLDSSKRLMAMGYAAEDIIPIMTTVGDAVAGLGAGQEGIDRATYALGQMKTAGRINAQDMMQLTSLGVPSWRYLAEAIGVTTEEVRKMSEQGLIPAELGINAILAGMEKDFGGMMSKQATTFTGAMSNIHDMLQQIIGQGFQPFFKEVSAAALALATFLQSADGTKFMNDLNAAVTSVVATMKEVIGMAFGVIQAFAGFVAANPWIWDVVKAVIALRVAMFALSIITAVVGMIQGLGFALGAVRAAFAIGGVIAGFQAAITLLAPGLVAATAGFGTAATAALAFAAALLLNPITWIVLGIGLLVVALAGLGGAFKSTEKQASDAAVGTSDAWKETHGYITGYNETAKAEAKVAGVAYSTSYADGLRSATPAAESAGTYLGTQTAAAVKAASVPAMGEAGAAAGTAFATEMTSAAMVAFRAGERDISGTAKTTTSDWQKALEESLAAANLAAAAGTVKSKLQQVFKITRADLAAAFKGLSKNMSAEVIAAGEAAIKDILAANLRERMLAAMTPKKRAATEAMLAVGDAMVSAMKASIDRAKAKLDELKQKLADLKAAAKAFAQQIADSIKQGVGLASTNMEKLTKQVATVTASTVGGITTLIRSITLQPIADQAGAVVQQFRDRLAKMREYIANIKKLTKMGLSTANIQEILSMGPEAGAQMAAALASGTKDQIKELNSLSEAMNKESLAMGTKISDQVYGKDIKSAQNAVRAQEAYIAGLQDQLAALLRGGAGGGVGTRTGRGTGTGVTDGTAGKYVPPKVGGPGNYGGGGTGGGSTNNNTVNVSLQGVAGDSMAERRAQAQRVAAAVTAALTKVNNKTNNGYIAV